MVECPTCKGKGTVDCQICGGEGTDTFGFNECDKCKGTGLLKCPNCKGTGNVNGNTSSKRRKPTTTQKRTRTPRSRSPKKLDPVDKVVQAFQYIAVLLICSYALYIIVLHMFF